MATKKKPQPARKSSNTRSAQQSAKRVPKKPAFKPSKELRGSKGSKASKGSEPWRNIAASALDWQEAHATLDEATKDLALELRGRRPDGLEHSAWELLEHIRLTQADLAHFMEDPEYVAPEWPRDYWPPAPQPPNLHAWDQAIAAVHRDTERIRTIARRRSLDLTSAIPWGEGKTYLRTILVAVVHQSYHIAQIIDVRRLLGAWPAPGT